LQANIEAMAAKVKARRRRPAAPTPRPTRASTSPSARSPPALSAQCCAKLGEAEALAEGGVSGLHITSPVVTPQAIARLIALHQANPDLSVVVDNLQNIADLAAAAISPLTVIVDINPGLHRTGVASQQAAVAAAKAIAAAET